MTKKMKKMEVEAGKVPPAIVKAKKDLLNQSKANIENEDNWYWEKPGCSKSVWSWTNE